MDSPPTSESSSFARKFLKDSILSLTFALSSDDYVKQVIAVAEDIATTFYNHGKILIAGNGGSAAHSQHLSSELVGRFLLDRSALPAISLTCDSSILTALSNDFGYDQIFTRQLSALAKPGDLFLCFTTSGTSTNILSGLDYCTTHGINTAVFTGERGIPDNTSSQRVICAPSRVTHHIQDIHSISIHLICALIDQYFRDRKLIHD